MERQMYSPDAQPQSPKQPVPMPQDSDQAFPVQPAPDIKKTFTPEPLDI